MSEQPKLTSAPTGAQVMVREYAPLNNGQKSAVLEIKQRCADLHDFLVHLENLNGRKRGFSIAKTKLEEVSMWAVKAITNPDLP